MKRVPLVVLFATLLFVSGCWWPWSRLRSYPVQPPDAGISVEVIREDLWRKGGSVAFIPFAPGDKVAAGLKFDRVAFSIIKGFSDSLRGSPFILLTGDASSGARYVIGGRVEDLSSKFPWIRLGFGKRRAVLRVRGEVRHQETGEIVALLFSVKKFDDVRDAPKVAYGIGQVLARKMGH